MTSILDQYNNTLRKDEATSKMASEPPNSGYFTFRTKDEAPIFTKQKMKLNLPEDITHLTVCNNWLVCLMSHQVLLRLFLPRPDKQNEVFVDKYMGGYNVSNLFFDPTGNHLLISLVPKSTGLPSELLYLHTKNNKPKRLDKFKEHEITAVAFNYNSGNENSTGPILLGTSKGLILETEFGIDGEKLYYNNWKQVFDLGRENPTPITGLNFYRMPDTNRYIVLVSTADKMYRFEETLKSEDKLVLQNIFTAYLNTPEKLLIYKDSTNTLKYSKLAFNCDMKKKFPKHFGWLIKNGIFYKQIQDLDQNGDTPTDITANELICFPTSKNIGVPKNFVITEFHVLILYADHIVSICTLNKATIYEEYFAEQYGTLLNIVQDIAIGSIYAYTPKAIFRYKITNEQRNVWKMYLEQNEFTLAEHYAKNNPAHLDIVLCQKGDMAFLAKNYNESAEIYSKTQISFERVSLKFLELNDKKPLMIFLNNRLDKLKEDEKTQITMLIVWMVELYLSEIARANNDLEKVRELQKDFDNFMSQSRVENCVRTNHSVIYKLMASHGDNHNLTALTTIKKDYESVINQYINQSEYGEALGVLRNQNKPDLFYKYCPILMEEIPQETISAIMEQKNRLNPEKLIPTIICISNEENKQIIKYLEYAIYKMASPSTPIHNYLVKLYAEHNKEKLEMYLETQGRDISLVHYDVHYALKVCEENNANSACVFLQCLLELWQPAVELALTYDSVLAQKTASQPQDNELKRKLWLKIAEHEIKGKNDVKKALELLKKCDLLRIEDLLPFFSDFQKIDDFKEAICDALKEYNLKIQEQQRDMEESAKSAERVREELQTLRNRSFTITAQEPCAICEIYLLLKPFFIFPCGHKFHYDCLEKQIIPYLSFDENRKLTNLKQQLENMSTVLIVSQNEPNNSQQTNTREQIKIEIENILAADCLYCGVMIEAIDQPFIEDEDWDKVNVDWQ